MGHERIRVGLQDIIFYGLSDTKHSKSERIGPDAELSRQSLAIDLVLLTAAIIFKN